MGILFNCVPSCCTKHNSDFTIAIKRSSFYFLYVISCLLVVRYRLSGEWCRTVPRSEDGTNIVSILSGFRDNKKDKERTRGWLSIMISFLSQAPCWLQMIPRYYLRSDFLVITALTHSATPSDSDKIKTVRWSIMEARIDALGRLMIV